MIAENKSALKGIYVITPDNYDINKLKKIKEKPKWCAVQYRDKINLNLKQATNLRAITYEWGIPLIINDNLQIALQIKADGLHLGENDLDLISARSKIGDSLILGSSCYNLKSRAIIAAKAGVDYISFGAFYPTPTKPNAPTATIDLLQWAKHDTALKNISVFAIGGILPHHCNQLIKNGADGIAMVRGILNSDNITQASKSYFKEYICSANSPPKQCNIFQ